MNQTLKAIWEYLDGKKSAIAATLNCLLVWVIVKGFVDDSTATLLAGLLTAWTGLAVGHTSVKNMVK